MFSCSWCNNSHNDAIPCTIHKILRGRSTVREYAMCSTQTTTPVKYQIYYKSSLWTVFRGNKNGKDHQSRGLPHLFSLTWPGKMVLIDGLMAFRYYWMARNEFWIFLMWKMRFPSVMFYRLRFKIPVNDLWKGIDVVWEE